MRTLSRLALPISRYISILSTANLNYTINGYIRAGSINDARKLFDENPKSRNVVSWNTLITGYIRHNQMSNAQDMFDKMPIRDTVSWNAMLSGSQKAKNPEKAYTTFLEMVRVGHKPTEFTFSIVLTAFLSSKFSFLLPQLHGLIIQSALYSCVFVGSALLRGYADLRDSEGLVRAFDEILVKDVTTWNALILGYMDLGMTSEAQRALGRMPFTNVISWTTLVNGYINNGKLDEARSVFYKMKERNVISWTAMIKGYVQYGKFLDALELFVFMLNSGTYPNQFTYSTVLEACAGVSSLFLGNQVHSCILKSGIPLDVILLTSLVDMYTKCGDIESAFSIFESISEKNCVSWNSIIGGYARHGLATRALEEFDRMTNSGVKPDEITFINVLSACGHGGLVEAGERHFNSMGTKYGIEAEMEHYACMVDLFGRAGQLEKAEKIVKEMPFRPSVEVWGALLGACGLHSCLELGEFSAKGLNSLEQDHPAVYSVLSKIHGEKGVWNNVIELRKIMVGKRAIKQKAGSWIESSHVVRCD